ncbi:MAG: hypothetical protein AAFO62_04050 [Pseudomonadota bacterium]
MATILQFRMTEAAIAAADDLFEDRVETAHPAASVPASSRPSAQIIPFPGVRYSQGAMSTGPEAKRTSSAPDTDADGRHERDWLTLLV